MYTDIVNKDVANVTLNGSLRVSLRGEKPYLIKWIGSEGVLGEMVVHPNTWGAFGLDKVDNYTFEFWDVDTGELINTYVNDLTNQYVLIITSLSSSLIPGKLTDTSSLVELDKSLKQEFKCNPVFYFKNSEKYNLPNNLLTLKMNDKYDFKLMIELSL